MKTELWNIGRIRPYENNPRLNDSAVDAVAKSIQEFGFRQPIVVDTEGAIICGHTRWKAAQKLGIQKVPPLRQQHEYQENQSPARKHPPRAGQATAAAERREHRRGTVYRRLEDARFQERLKELRREMVERAAWMLSAASIEAVKTLLDLQRANVSHTVRLGAARAVLELGAKLREGLELEDRLQALEEMLAHGGPFAEDENANWPHPPARIAAY